MKTLLLQKKDIQACAAIVGKNYSKKWQLTSWQEIKSMFSHSAINPVYWVVEDNKIIIGFAGYIQSWMDYNVYQIFWVNVSPEFQGRGVGKKLVSKVISEIKKNKNARLIQLTATPSNARYYKKYFNFKTVQKFNSSSPYHLMILLLERR